MNLYEFWAKTDRARPQIANRAKAQRGDGTASKYLSDAQPKELLQYVEDKGDLAGRKSAARAIIGELTVAFLVDNPPMRGTKGERPGKEVFL